MMEVHYYYIIRVLRSEEEQEEEGMGEVELLMMFFDIYILVLRCGRFMRVSYCVKTGHWIGIWI